MKLTFFVDALPTAQPRQRGDKHNYIPHDHAIHGWRDHVRVAAHNAIIRARWRHSDRPLRLEVLAYLQPTKKYPAGAWYCAHPDSSNILKGVEDALNRVAWSDDRFVCDTRLIKRSAPVGEKIGALVMVEEL